MLSIKDTILRVGRSVRQIDSVKKKPTKSALGPTILPPQKVLHRPSINLPNKDVNKYRESLERFQTKRFRDFLAPLEMSNLKIFNDNLPQFNTSSATSNWHAKSEKSPKKQYINFVNDRVLFDKMMDFLIDITPPHLKFVRNSNLPHILQEYEENVQDSKKFRDVAKNEFHELPPMPQELTPASFEKYIYQLTNSSFHYRNSSSLTSGIIPDILLYTHKLTNEKYKPFRSVNTFNYLIKFFGYDKNQSSFARELILVMIKDGHKPNIDTINNLLKICQLHSHIRTNTNTYQVIMKYLRLCQAFDIEINLMTYVRIYDCVSNIFLRESFLNKIQIVGLPVLKSLLLRIIDDFSLTTKDTSELIKFIETDLARANWYEENIIANKVIYHRGLHVQNQQDIINLWTFVTNRINGYDEYTLKSLFESIKKNENLPHKAYLMTLLYFKSGIASENNVRIFQFLIRQLVNESNTNVSGLSFVIRGLIHDMKEAFCLPLEIVQYSNNKQSHDEAYSIVNRIIGNQYLNPLEAKLQYLKIAPLSTPVDVDKWQQFKQILLSQPLECAPLDKLWELLPFATTEANIPPQIINKYLLTLKHKMINIRDRDRVLKLKEGVDNYTLRLMKERGLIKD